MTAAHVDCHGQGLDDLFARGARAGERLGMKADAAVAMARDANGERDQFLLLRRECTGLHRALGQRAEPGHRIGCAFANFRNAAVYVGGNLIIGLGHGSTFRYRCAQVSAPRDSAP